MGLVRARDTRSIAAAMLLLICLGQVLWFVPHSFCRVGRVLCSGIAEIGVRQHCSAGVCVFVCVCACVCVCVYACVCVCGRGKEEPRTTSFCSFISLAHADVAAGEQASVRQGLWKQCANRQQGGWQTRRRRGCDKTCRTQDLLRVFTHKLRFLGHRCSSRRACTTPSASSA